jgi:pyroglutamyl-peptidase
MGTRGYHPTSHLSYNLALSDGYLERGLLRAATTDAPAGAGGAIKGRALVTGFQPYNEGEVNPSGELATALDGEDVAGLEVVGRVLPVSAASTPEAVRAAIDEVAPALVLMFGVWPGRHALTIERVAVNVLDFPYPDNDGAQPQDLPIAEDCPAAFLTPVFLRAVVEDWLAAGLPGAISYTAGTYVCNLSYYTALRHTEESGLPVAFVHVPTVPSEAARHEPPLPSMPLATLLEGARIAVSAIARTTVTAS